MIKVPFKECLVLAGLAVALAFCVHFLQATPALSATELAATKLAATELAAAEQTPTELTRQPEVLVKLGPEAIATAPQAPKLVSAILGGKPVYVLYSTRADDVILVRCYPTYQPSLQVRVMGGQPNQKEGTLTCKANGTM
jgi:ABC-type Fe3+-hydroxamate transport system substrate-binding protein